jgi:hypothetical protein
VKSSKSRARQAVSLFTAGVIFQPRSGVPLQLPLAPAPTVLPTDRVRHLAALVFAFPLIEMPNRLAILIMASGFLPVLFTMVSRSDVLASSISLRSSENERPERFGEVAIQDFPSAPAAASW